jgi:D,D-heptose 1,7-bisphosphate phosphatase
VLKQAVLLVGGRGTRLGALTETTPKPLLPVAGRPFIRYLIDNAIRHGLTEILLLASRGAEAVEAMWGAGSEGAADLAREGVSITVVKEPAAAGTAGALLHARDHLDDTFLLASGDSFFDFNWLDLLTVPADEQWQARVALRQVADGACYGRVEVADSKIIVFDGSDRPGPAVINGGVYVLRRSLLEAIGAMPCSLEHDLFPPLAAHGRLFGRIYDGFFIDIGVPEDYARADRLMTEAWRRPAVFLDRDGVVNVDHGYVHRPDQVEWIAGAKRTIKWFNDAGFFVFVVSNQAGVARGYYSEADVGALHGWMAGELQAIGAHVDQFEYCPYHPEGTVAQYRRASDRRKPAAGMLLDCMARWPVDKSRSFLIGDKPIDLEAAAAAEIPGYLFSSPDLLAFTTSLLAART